MTCFNFLVWIDLVGLYGLEFTWTCYYYWGILVGLDDFVANTSVSLNLFTCNLTKSIRIPSFVVIKAIHIILYRNHFTFFGIVRPCYCIGRTERPNWLFLLDIWFEWVWMFLWLLIDGAEVIGSCVFDMILFELIEYTSDNILGNFARSHIWFSLVASGLSLRGRTVRTLSWIQSIDR